MQHQYICQFPAPLSPQLLKTPVLHLNSPVTLNIDVIIFSIVNNVVTYPHENINRLSGLHGMFATR